MKRFISIALIFVFLMTMATIGMAAPAPKIATVSVSASATTVRVGETVELIATTLKQGSSYNDSWLVATKGSTNLNSDGYYVSTATFKSAVPGKYELSYDITMSAGKSGVTFNGSQSITIIVVDPAKIVGATVKHIVATPVYNPKGHLTGYDAVGDVYAVWSNGAESYYGETTFKFSPNQIERNIDVEVNGITYTVSVSR